MTKRTTSPKLRTHLSSQSMHHRLIYIMCCKIACCILSIATLTLCFLPYEWEGRIFTIPTRYLVICATSGSIIQHLYDFVFDDAFLHNFKTIRFWITVPILSLLSFFHESVPRYLLSVSALMTICVDNWNVDIFVMCLTCFLDAMGVTIAFAWLIDRFMVRSNIPLTSMCFRQAFEFCIFSTIVLTRNGLEMF